MVLVELWGVWIINFFQGVEIHSVDTDGMQSAWCGLFLYESRGFSDA